LVSVTGVQELEDCSTILMTAYNFPVGGPLTLKIENVGTAPVNLTGATYWLASYD